MWLFSSFDILLLENYHQQLLSSAQHFHDNSLLLSEDFDSVIDTPGCISMQRRYTQLISEFKFDHISGVTQ